MKSKKLIYQIFPANILVTIGAILALFWYGSTTLKTFYIDETETSLLARAYSIEEQVTPLLESHDVQSLRQLARRIGRKTSSRITVISPTGLVIADSSKDQEKMDNHKSRPEIQTAFTNKTGVSMRFSRSVGEKMLYVAIPLYGSKKGPQKDVTGVLRLSVSVARMEATLKKVQTDAILGMFIVVCIAALITMIVSRRITTPLEEMTKGAKRFATGQFTPRLTPPDHVSSEIETLSQALNSMAEQLQERISTILRQRDELQIFLDSMLAAVLTVDKKQRITSINSAAANLFDITPENSIGRPIFESIRNLEILKIIRKTINDGYSVEDEVHIVKKNCNHSLLTNCIPLHNEQERNFGVLLVLNDVTRLRHLENIRRDFVANVSHELKTPITAIKGYAETLLDDDMEDKANSLRFLNTVLKKANHLDAIVDDLLALSSIEHLEEAGKVNLTIQRLKPILEEAIHTCAHRTEQKNISLKLECGDDLSVYAHKVLLEQAVANLIINSIQYSSENNSILVTAKEEKHNQYRQITIDVQDFGIGIGKKHLPRIFERFYRSDTARSRKLGGTGLGLAIVKHIVQVHNGDVSITSREGEGTTVTLSLPVNAIP